MPQWVLLCCDGRCESCDIDEVYSQHMSTKTCQYCSRKLVPIGNSRINGASHDDWDTTRKMYKKCWIQWKKEQEESDEYDSFSDDSSENESSDN